MCGILIHIGREKLGSEHPALEIIRHRGPDGHGAMSFETPAGFLTLGHRRLAIIDLDERSNQPMQYENGNSWIVFNGEIYNYLELKKELSSLGCEFRTESDTEVILAAFRKWGRQCLSRFNGMFSFCIYDKKEGRLFLARDRFGIKPLYFWNNSDTFCAASEIKQFTCIPGFTPAANREKLYHFINSSDFDYDRETMWKNVFEIEPGHFAELNLGSWKPGSPFKTEKWYDLDFDRTIEISYEDAVCEFRNLLKDSIRLRMRADVPVGFLLSGGLDSSSLVGLSTQIPRDANATLKTFSSCYENSPIDERKFINGMLDFSRASSSLHFPKPQEVPENLDRIIWHNDIPVRHGSPVPHWLLYKHIREDNDFRKVIIEGQGGDEILGGYIDFCWSFIFELLMAGKISSFSNEFSAFRAKDKFSLKIFMRKFGRMMFPETVSYPANPAIIPESLIGSAPVPPIPIRREQPSVKDMHRARMRILRYILHNVDRNSMSHSRETRVPFLDYRLAEFCVSLPSRHKLSSGTTKRVLRSAVGGIVPDMIINRVDKQGYSSPMPSWLGKEISGFFKESVDEASKLPFANRKLVLLKAEDFHAGKSQFDPVLWNLITADKWIKMFKISV
ncbi:MAG TPA: asparagine synthase (glutamine-hydrolyzing) [Lentisphaeria bacterium]|nr:MAG: asparagine synthase (glutamine-hydrolyzing) [Lentisphaerae bacterium GWF2_50_93]HCE45619.1 asparagine synthase (glutamine-hydrolyzing) [Lentisphaeria bacterium]